jgi:hypothetical protein
MNRSIATAFLALWIALAAGPARAAEARPAVAPPGRCAEPRAAGQARADASAYPVTGPVSSLFDPRDVAAGPPAGVQPPQPPTARALIRPGPCDQPGSGCGLRTSTVVEVPPVSPGVRPPRAPN